MPSVDEIRRTALALPERDRAALAHDLIVSLDDQGEMAEDPEFMAEIMRRAAEVEAGTVQMTEWRQCMEELRKELADERASR